MRLLAYLIIMAGAWLLFAAAGLPQVPGAAPDGAGALPLPTSAPVAWVAPTATPIPLAAAAVNEPALAFPVRLVGRGVDAGLVPYRLPTAENPVPDPLPDIGAAWSGDVLPGTWGGNVVIAAHNYALPALEHARVGDVFEIVMSDGATYRYRLFDRLIVQEEGVSWEQRLENGRWVGQHWPGQDRLTVVTCWPFPNGTSHRLLLIGERV